MGAREGSEDEKSLRMGAREGPRRTWRAGGAARGWVGGRGGSECGTRGWVGTGWRMTREWRYEAGPRLANAAWVPFGSEARVIEMLGSLLTKATET